MELHEQLELVDNQESFLDFARMLILDRVSAVKAEARNPVRHYGADAEGWENTSIETFLESAVSWAEDSNFGATQGLADASPWKQFAVFLYCGKIYE